MQGQTGFILRKTWLVQLMTFSEEKLVLGSNKTTPDNLITLITTICTSYSSMTYLAVCRRQKLINKLINPLTNDIYTTAEFLRLIQWDWQ